MTDMNFSAIFIEIAIAVLLLLVLLLDLILGEFSPSGRQPLTFPITEEAIAVDENGICASPNDVPGYAKEQHMDGRPYVYVDADGNRWQLGHGLSYDG